MTHHLIDFNDKNSSFSALLELISVHEALAQSRLHLIASENTLSPLAKLPFLLDTHSRYFLDDFRRFGKWYFPSGELQLELEEGLLTPLLSELAQARYVNTRAISGMNCMLIALTALTAPGNMIFSIPLAHGGHASTKAMTERLALVQKEIPFVNGHDIDYDQLKQMIQYDKPTLIYLDQATFLFPLDPKPIRQLIDAYSPNTLLHYDSSHINGLILGGALFNPLLQGAHCFGGSTHKTLPGPHKGFLATNDQTIALKIQHQSEHFVSHHHPSSALSLAITLLEMKWCGGANYANQVILNGKHFGEALDAMGFCVAEKERGFTGAHQIWMYPPQQERADAFAQQLTKVGIMASYFDTLPGISHPAFRLSFAELTRMGAMPEDATQVARLMSMLWQDPGAFAVVQEQIKALRKKLSTPKFCFEKESWSQLHLPEPIAFLCQKIV